MSYPAHTGRRIQTMALTTYEKALLEISMR